VRRLTGDEHLSAEFATTWPTYAMDDKTRALLGYAKKLTEAPALLGDSAFESLRQAGWDDEAIYDATALIGFFNFTGRLEAASGLPQDEIPATARIAEARR
jgi:alkylhydroperoxidase family enzyme